MNRLLSSLTLRFVMTVALATAVTLGSLGCGGTVKRPDGGTGLLQPGAPAPDVVGHLVDASEVRLSSLRGRPVVVFFYPQDNSPGCTKEACAFRDAWARLEKGNVGVLGVSTNSQEKHRTFQREKGLPFALASDESGEVGKAFGVPRRLWGYERVSFLIDRQGKIARVWPSVDPGIHADDVIREAALLP